MLSLVAAPVLSLSAYPALSSDKSSTKIVEFDERVPFAEQLKHDEAPVVLLSTFLVAPGYEEEFLAGFKKQFAIMHGQPGLISAQLHKAIAGSGLFMNYVVWESVEDFKRGFESEAFQAQLKEYPPGTVVSAGFFQRVAVEGMSLGEQQRSLRRQRFSSERVASISRSAQSLRWDFL
jgi:heme-degrading monooxygenase HmoA